MPPKVDEQLLLLAEIRDELGLQTTAMQQLTAAVQGLATAATSSPAIQKFLAESIEHYVDYMTGEVTHDQPLP